MAIPYKRRFGYKDALQIAYYGLVRAAAKFDENLGAFPSYAQIWIKLSFQEAGIYSSIVYVPRYKSKELYKKNKEGDTLYEPFEMVSLETMSDHCEMHFIDEIKRDFNNSNDPESLVESLELWTKILLGLNVMPEQLRITFLRLYGLCEQLPISRIECALLLNVHRNTIKDYHDRGLSMLREFLCER